MYLEMPEICKFFVKGIGRCMNCLVSKKDPDAGGHKITGPLQKLFWKTAGNNEGNSKIGIRACSYFD